MGGERERGGRRRAAAWIQNELSTLVLRGPNKAAVSSRFLITIYWNYGRDHNKPVCKQISAFFLAFFFVASDDDETRASTEAAPSSSSSTSHPSPLNLFWSPLLLLLLSRVPAYPSLKLSSDWWYWTTCLDSFSSLSLSSSFQEARVLIALMKKKGRGTPPGKFTGRGPHEKDFGDL